MQLTSHLDDIRRNANFKVTLQTHVGEYSKLMQLCDLAERHQIKSARQSHVYVESRKFRILDNLLH